MTTNSNVTVVVRVLFAADQRWPNAVKQVHFNDGVLKVTCNTNIGMITIVFEEEDFNFRIRDVSITKEM